MDDVFFWRGVEAGCVVGFGALVLTSDKLLSKFRKWQTEPLPKTYAALDREATARVNGDTAHRTPAPWAGYKRCSDCENCIPATFGNLCLVCLKKGKAGLGAVPQTFAATHTPDPDCEPCSKSDDAPSQKLVLVPRPFFALVWARWFAVGLCLFLGGQILKAQQRSAVANLLTELNNEHDLLRFPSPKDVAQAEMVQSLAEMVQSLRENGVTCPEGQTWTRDSIGLMGCEPIFKGFALNSDGGLLEFITDRSNTQNVVTCPPGQYLRRSVGGFLGCESLPPVDRVLIPASTDPGIYLNAGVADGGALPIWGVNSNGDTFIDARTIFDIAAPLPEPNLGWDRTQDPLVCPAGYRTVPQKDSRNTQGMLLQHADCIPDPLSPKSAFHHINHHSSFR